MKNQFTITLTLDQFEAAKQRLAVQFPEQFPDQQPDKAPTGTLSAHGVTLDYAYVDGTLTITVEHKPFLYPEGEVEKKIRDWFSA